MNQFNQTKNKHNISLKDYSLIKKYVSTESCIKQAFIDLTQNDINIHRQLIREDLSNIFKKEVVGMLFARTHLPYKDVKIEDLTPTKSGDNQKLFKQVMNNLPNMIGKPVILNFYSEIAEQATQASVYVTEQLMTSYKAITTNGIELNKKSVDFDDSTALDDLLSKDFLTIFSLNSVFITDFRKQFLDNLFTLAKLQNKPIITSSNVELKLPQFKVINLRLTDKKLNASQVIDEIFGEVR